MSDWRDKAKKKCPVCGETYWPAPREAQVKWEARKACGRVCGGIYANKKPEALAYGNR
jgi:hypothetical protein